MVKKRKKFLLQKKEQIKATHQNVLYLKFFEERIALKNKPDSPEEYFFSDKENFLKNSLFKDPSFCGSFALIKPNGQVLIRNGESTADIIANYLNPEIWYRLFPESE